MYSSFAFLCKRPTLLFFYFVSICLVFFFLNSQTFFSFATRQILQTNAQYEKSHTHPSKTLLELGLNLLLSFVKTSLSSSSPVTKSCKGRIFQHLFGCVSRVRSFITDFVARSLTFSVACFIAGIARILLRLKLRVEFRKSSRMLYISLDTKLNSVLNDIQIIGDDFQHSTRNLRRNRMSAISVGSTQQKRYA